jgi:hypothetical protein
VNGNYVKGVATVGDRLVLLLDPASVLSLDGLEAVLSPSLLEPAS